MVETAGENPLTELQETAVDVGSEDQRPGFGRFCHEGFDRSDRLRDRTSRVHPAPGEVVRGEVGQVIGEPQIDAPIDLAASWTRCSQALEQAVHRNIEPDDASGAVQTSPDAGICQDPVGGDDPTERRSRVWFAGSA